MSMNNRISLNVFATVVLLASSGVMAESMQETMQETMPEPWTFTVSPYLWLPNVNGNLIYSIPPAAAGAPEVEVGPNDYLSNLNVVLMLSGEARKGRWSAYTDVIYLEFSSEESKVKAINFGASVVATSLNVNTSSSLTGLAWTLAGGYRAVHTSQAILDVLGGFRHFKIDASSDWQLTAAVNEPGGGQTFPQLGSIDKHVDLWGAIVGARGRLRLGAGPWSMPYYLDVGTGSSTVTWQALLGVTYDFKWGDVVLAYRHLAYDQNDDKLLQDFRFSGPVLGATFRF